MEESMSKWSPLVKSGLMAVCLFLAVGCASLEYYGTKGYIVGAWRFKNPENGPQTLTFKRDGTFELDTDGNGIKNIWGSYRLSQDWVILNDVGGESTFDCAQEGAYSYQVSKNDETLKFTLMADQCVPRTQAMSMEWSRIHKRLAPPVKIKI
jgi:hypothetical protein